MSIRIYNDGLAGAAASQAARAEELSRAAGGSKPSQSPAATGEDQVEISSLSEGVSTQSAQHASRVQHLAALYQSGKYHVDATNVAHAIVNDALTTGGTSGGHE